MALPRVASSASSSTIRARAALDPPLAAPARGRFSERFVADLTTAWEQYGETALAETAKLYPDRFVAICSHLIPKDVSVSLTARLPANLDASDWELLLEVLSAVKQSVPDAGSREPRAVLEHVLEAIRMANATPTIEGDAAMQKTPPKSMLKNPHKA